MATYLLDTHTCIWAITEQNQLSKSVKNILGNSEHSFWVSQISLFELAIKLKIGKLPDFKVELGEFIRSVRASGFEILPMKEDHLVVYTRIDFHIHHRDPFDRYLLAAASSEGMGLITRDEKFQWYKDRIEVVW